VRLMLRETVYLLTIGLFVLVGGASGQNPDTILPEKSTEMSKRIVGQLIEVLGGPAYMGMEERQCDGRRALIGHSGELAGYIGFKESWRYPDKERIDYVAHGHNTLLGYLIGVQDLDITKGGLVVTLYNGDHGWLMNRTGVSELPETTVSQFQEAVRQNVDNLLRLKLKEKGVLYRWGGLGTVDLRPVDWVEVTDPSGLTVQLAVDRSTHLLVRSKVVTEDEEFHQPREDVVIYTNFQPRGGVQIPMQITRERDGRRLSQVFYDDCRVGPGLPADFFTREGLERKLKEVGGKSKPEK
jgi:hypothetical protein